MGVACLGLSIVLYLNAERQKTRIKAIEVYGKDVRVIREKEYDRGKEFRRFWMVLPEGDIVVSQGLKSQITEFSKASRKNLAFVASNTQSEFTRMITLTYPSEYTNDGRESKKHLNAILQWMRRRGLKHYLWFLEFQKRGAPHYHILIDGSPEISKDELSEAWYRIVGSNDERHLLAGTRIEGAKNKRGLHNYAVKYASKLYQKNIPVDFRNVGRLWGCDRDTYPRRVLYLQVDCESSLSDLLSGWENSGKEREGYSILFGASQSVVAKLKSIGFIQVDEDNNCSYKE